MALQVEDPEVRQDVVTPSVQLAIEQQEQKKRDAEERAFIDIVLADPGFDVPGYGKVNLLQAFPLTLGDWKALGRQGVTPERLDPDTAPSVEVAAAFVLYVMRKATNGQLKAQHLDALSMKRFGELGRKLSAIARAEQLDIPFSTPAIYSVDGTDGPLTT